MRILGIDPGTINFGYGVVDGEDKMTMVDCGVLTFSSRIPIEQRLHSLHTKLNEIITRYQPDEVAIEEPFVAKNVRSALAVGRSQAVAMLAGAGQGLPVYCYTPTYIKQQVTGYGNSSKEQVKEVVKIQLDLSRLPQSSDAADALAVAICHLRQIHLKRVLSASKE